MSSCESNLIGWNWTNFTARLWVRKRCLQCRPSCFTTFLLCLLAKVHRSHHCFVPSIFSNLAIFRYLNYGLMRWELSIVVPLISPFWNCLPFGFWPRLQYSGLQSPLPSTVHVFTLESVSYLKVLLRLEHLGLQNRTVQVNATVSDATALQPFNKEVLPSLLWSTGMEVSVVAISLTYHST